MALVRGLARYGSGQGAIPFLLLVNGSCDPEHGLGVENRGVTALPDEWDSGHSDRNRTS